MRRPRRGTSRWATGSHEHGLACELQRRDARRARRGLSRPAPLDDEGNFSRGKWPGPGASRTMSACPRHRRRCPGEVAQPPVDERWIVPRPHRADLGRRRGAPRRSAVGCQLPRHEGPHGRDGPGDPRGGPVGRRADHPGRRPPPEGPVAVAGGEGAAPDRVDQPGRLHAEPDPVRPRASPHDRVARRPRLHPHAARRLRLELGARPGQRAPAGPGRARPRTWAAPR